MKKLLTAAVIGLILGCATSFGQTYIPEPFKQFANSYSVWLLVAYFFGEYGASSHRIALAGGALLEITALVGYYLTTNIRLASGIGTSATVLMWALGGIIGGPLLAAGAYIGRCNYTVRLVAISCIALIILSEAGYMFAVLHYLGQGFCFVGLALLFIATQFTTLPARNLTHKPMSCPEKRPS